MSRREKNLLIAALIIIFILLARKYLFSTGPVNFSRIIKEINELESELEICRKELQGMIDLVEEFEDYYSKNKKLERLFYSGEPADLKLEIINYLDSEITASGLLIESKEFFVERVSENIADNTEKKYLKIPVKISYQAHVKGGYQELLTFMENLEKSSKYYSIGQLEI